MGMPGVRVCAGGQRPPAVRARVRGDEGFLEESFDHLEASRTGGSGSGPATTLIAAALQAHFPAAQSLLEVGCGTGYVAADLHRRLPALRIAAGTRSTPASRSRTSASAGDEIFQMDARKIPLRQRVRRGRRLRRARAHPRARRRARADVRRRRAGRRRAHHGAAAPLVVDAAGRLRPARAALPAAGAAGGDRGRGAEGACA